MNFRKDKQYTAEVYTGSLNDIMFFLLLFFLLVSTMANPSIIKLLLPKSAPAQSVSKQQVAISITKDKRYYVRIKSTEEEVPFANLEKVLGEKMKAATDLTVVLRMDNGLTIQDLVDLLQIGNKLKVKMVLATKITQ